MLQLWHNPQLLHLQYWMTIPKCAEAILDSTWPNNLWREDLQCFTYTSPHCRYKFTNSPCQHATDKSISTLFLWNSTKRTHSPSDNLSSKHLLEIICTPWASNINTSGLKERWDHHPICPRHYHHVWHSTFFINLFFNCPCMHMFLLVYDMHNMLLFWQAFCIL